MRVAMAIVAAACAVAGAWAQITPTAEDFARSGKVLEWWGKVYQGPAKPQWLCEGLGFWYKTSTREGSVVRLVRSADGQMWKEQMLQNTAEI